jgi:hypothetical protein
MKNALRLNIQGIKCDNKDCDYRNENARIEDMEKWLNKPCPKCGQNLFTVKDYISLKILITLVNLLNAILPKGKDDAKKAEVFSVEMNGTGEVNFIQEEKQA